MFSIGYIFHNCSCCYTFAKSYNSRLLTRTLARVGWGKIDIVDPRIAAEPIIMSAKKPKNAFRRTRNDHANETAEDYVEAIAEILGQRDGVCRASDLARHFAVSHVTVHRIVLRLQDEGLLLTEPYKPIKLTAKGKRLAKKSRERHEVVYAFLLALGVSPEVAAIDAEGIEHHVSQQTLDCFAAWRDRIG